jgi:hypothetical protein
LAGRTPHEARSNFLGPLPRALSCVTDAQVVYRPNAPGHIEALSLSEEPIRIPCASGDTPWWLSVEQRYTLIEADDPTRGPWKVSTRAYRYRLDNDAGEVASWHWHPAGRSKMREPHLHVSDGPLANAHLPTRRVGLEAVLHLLLVDLDARPRRDDWSQVLGDVERAFHQWQTWA